MFLEESGQYTIREVFYRDGAIVNYGRYPLVARGGSPSELADEIASMQEALSLPALTIADVESEIAKQPPKSQKGNTISHQELVKKLGLEDEMSQETESPILVSTEQ